MRSSAVHALGVEGAAPPPVHARNSRAVGP